MVISDDDKLVAEAIHLYMSKDPFIKQAFDVSELMSNLKESVIQSVKSYVKPGAPWASVLSLLASTTLFRINPFLGIIASISTELMGIDIAELMTNITGEISKKVESGEDITEETIKQTTGSFLGGGVVTSYQRFNIIKNAKNYKFQQEWKSQPIWNSGSKASILQRMFFGASNGRKRNFVYALIVWVIKTVLIAAGLMTVGGIAKGVTKTIAPGTTPETSPFGMNTQKPNKGTIYTGNNPEEIWIEPLKGKRPHEMILDWTYDTYPDLEQYEDIILRTPSFWATVTTVTKNWSPHEGAITMPNDFSSREDVIKKFYQDVKAQIKQ